MRQPATGIDPLSFFRDETVDSNALKLIKTSLLAELKRGAFFPEREEHEAGFQFDDVVTEPLGRRACFGLVGTL